MAQEPHNIATTSHIVIMELLSQHFTHHGHHTISNRFKMDIQTHHQML